LLDQFRLLGLGGLLRFKAADLFLQLSDPLPQLLLLSQPGGPPQLEELAFARQCFLHVGIGGLVRELFGRTDCVGAVALGRQARFAGVKLDQSLLDDRQVGAGHGFIEPHERIAGLDAIAIAHAHFADHASRRVLHLLHVGIDDHEPRRYQRAGNLGGRRPAAEADGENRDDDAADDDMPAYGRSGAARFGLHAAPS